MADDLMRLQRQAALRVQQMQDHSRRVFETYQGRPPQAIGNPPPPSLQSPGLYAVASSPHTTPPPSGTQALSLPALETEQWLLLGLAMLLWRCGCRTELLLALLYLAL